MIEKTKHISIVGLPGSGKTTLLAATWHLVRENGATTVLSFDKLSDGNYEHLNEITKRWRAGQIQQRTQVSGLKSTSMRLKNSDGDLIEVSFPDIPGEEFRDMWEKRELDHSLNSTLSAASIVLIVNGDTIQLPAWVVDRMAIAKAAGLNNEEQIIKNWNISDAPTQVKIVELLQMLMTGKLDIGERRLAILISAWDRVIDEELCPEKLLAVKLPLLDQYLRNGRDPWTWRIWGLSAQGGAYEDPDDGESNPDTEALRELENPSERIMVVDGKVITNDLTQPMEWLVT